MGNISGMVGPSFLNELRFTVEFSDTIMMHHYLPLLCTTCRILSEIRKGPFDACCTDNNHTLAAVLQETPTYCC